MSDDPSDVAMSQADFQRQVLALLQRLVQQVDRYVERAERYDEVPEPFEFKS